MAQEVSDKSRPIGKAVMIDEIEPLVGQDDGSTLRVPHKIIFVCMCVCVCVFYLCTISAWNHYNQLWKEITVPHSNVS